MILIEKTLIYFVIATYLFITLAPLLWVLSTSFKPNQEAISFPPKFLPDSPTFDNYLFVLTDPKLVTSLINSLAVSLGSTGLSVVVSALGGYAFARFDFKGKNLLISTILGLFMIPVVINIIPLYILLSNLGLLNSLLALVLTFQILIIPLNIFLLKNYFETIPKELEEAALVSGATIRQNLMRIVLPLVAPMAGGIFLWVFVHSLREFSIAVMMKSGRNEVLVEGLDAVSAVRTGPDAELYVLQRSGTVSKLVQG